jgi:hypothetical protein
MDISYRRTRESVSMQLVLTVFLIMANPFNEFASAANVSEIVDQVSRESYTDYLRNDLYTHDGDERYFGPQHDLAQQRIMELFESFGLETSLYPFEFRETTYYNVVGMHRGISCPTEIYVLGAHYDSVEGAPGAMDNGSGVAGLLESARVLSQHAFEGTIVFIAFDREEQGFRGSRAYANDHIRDHIHGMLNLDCIAPLTCGPEHPGYNKIRLSWNIFYRQLGQPTRLVEDLANAVESYTELTCVVHPYLKIFGGSDHDSFADVGFEAVQFEPYDCQENPSLHIHSAVDSVDQPDWIDYDQGTRVTQAIVASLATLAMPAPARIYPDFDGDGDVDIEDCVLLIGHWEGSDSCFDVAPPPNGDGIVNDQDLGALLHYAMSDRSSWWDFERSANAGNPVPADGATDVFHDTMLSWYTRGFTQIYDVYLGTVFDDVNAAGAGSELLVGPGLSNRMFITGRLEFGQTYFWRVDEVNAPPDNTVFKGDIWSFTVESFAYPIATESIIPTASSQSEGMGPEKTIDGSGLGEYHLHSTSTTTMWLSTAGEPGAAWIQYEFDKIYKLHEMLVWNYNGDTISTLFGLKKVTVEYSTDAVNWSQLTAVSEFAQATGSEGYATNTTVLFNGAAAKYVRITANSNWMDDNVILSRYGLSEVRFMYIPVRARNPSPESGATDVSIEPILSWKSGREATEHEFYFSTDRQAVVDGTARQTAVAMINDGTALVVTETLNIYPCCFLEPGRTYYWKVNEVNEAEAISIWEGDVWEFTTAE